MKQTNLLLICGGNSAEHSISLVSAWNFLSTIDKERFHITLIAINKHGNWYLQSIKDFLAQQPNPKTITIPNQTTEIFVKFGPTQNKFYNSTTGKFLAPVDVVFPLLHGPNGEDGNIQGILNQLQLPFVGCDVLSSAICMDKGVAKRLMLQANIPTSKFETYTIEEKELLQFDRLSTLLGSPLFIKPANMGSSVGINKAETENEFIDAISEAFQYDDKIIIEEFVDGIEIECAVLGNDELQVSIPGTYVHSDDFFDFDTKYLKGNDVTMQIPAKQLTTQQQQELMELSKKAYRVLACEGLARVDTFVTQDGRYFVNEINTMPGFTQHSMYPVLMNKLGIGYTQLVQNLCNLAIERFNKKNT